MSNCLVLPGPGRLADASVIAPSKTVEAFAPTLPAKVEPRPATATATAVVERSTRSSESECEKAVAWLASGWKAIWVIRMGVEPNSDAA